MELIFKRKAYEEMLIQKKEFAPEYALLLKGATHRQIDIGQFLCRKRIQILS